MRFAELSMPLNDDESRVLSQIIEELSNLDIDSQRLVCMKLRDKMLGNNMEPAYRPWPMFPPTP